MASAECRSGGNLTTAATFRKATCMICALIFPQLSLELLQHEPQPRTRSNTIAHLARLALDRDEMPVYAGQPVAASSTWSSSSTRPTRRASSPWRIRFRPGAAPARRRGHRDRPARAVTSATRRRSKPACTSCPGSSSRARLRRMHTLTLPELAARPRSHAEFSSAGAHAAHCLGAHRAARSRRSTPSSRVTAESALAARRRPRTQRLAAGEARPAHRRADRAQGHLLHRRASAPPAARRCSTNFVVALRRHRRRAARRARAWSCSARPTWTSSPWARRTRPATSAR